LLEVEVAPEEVTDLLLAAPAVDPQDLLEATLQILKLDLLEVVVHLKLVAAVLVVEEEILEDIWGEEPEVRVKEVGMITLAVVVAEAEVIMVVAEAAAVMTLEILPEMHLVVEADLGMLMVDI
jgi:hypothetical protein